MESKGKMVRGKGSGFDPQLGRQWGKFVGFLEASNVRISGKLGLILEGVGQWGKFAAQSAFYPYYYVFVISGGCYSLIYRALGRTSQIGSGTARGTATG